MRADILKQLPDLKLIAVAATGDAHGRALGTQVGGYVWAKAQAYFNGSVPG